MAVFRWKDFFCEDSITLTISPCFDNIENHNRMHKQTIAVLTVPKKIWVKLVSIPDNKDGRKGKTKYVCALKTRVQIKYN